MFFSLVYFPHAVLACYLLAFAANCMAVPLDLQLHSDWLTSSDKNIFTHTTAELFCFIFVMPCEYMIEIFYHILGSYLLKLSNRKW